MTKLNLWDALKPTMILQRVYCISPFRRVGNLLKPSLLLSIYGFVSLIAYYILMVYSALLIIEIGNVLPFFQRSYLWAVIGGFEILFNNFGFVVLMILSEFKKNQQLSFLNRIYDVDVVMAKEFQSEMMYKNLYFKNILAVLLCLIYYEGLTVFVLLFLHGYGLTSLGLYTFAFLYQYEQICSGTMSLTYINYVLLIRERFRILKNVQIQLTNEFSIGNKSNLFKTSKLFLTYKDLCSLIELINDNYGIMLIIRIAHDFTLTTSQVYLISWIFMDSQVSNKIELVVCITLWMIQNIVKIGLTTLSAELTVKEVRFFLIFKVYYTMKIEYRHLIVDIYWIYIIATVQVNTCNTWLIHL